MAIDLEKYKLPPQQTATGSLDLSKYKSAPPTYTGSAGQTIRPGNTLGQSLGDLSNFRDTLFPSEKVLGDATAGALLPATKDAKALETSRANLNTVSDKAIALLKEKVRKGEDITKLVSVLKSTGQIPNDFDVNTALNLTDKQVIGGAIGTFNDIASAGALPGALGAATTPAKTVVGGVLKGAGIGALTGAGFGGLQGVSGAMRENKTNNEIASSGIKGAALGAVTGGVLGGVTGGISTNKALAPSRDEQKNIDFARELTSPKVTQKTSTQAIEEGRMTEAGIFKRAKIAPSANDNLVADSVIDVVSPKNSTVENVDAIKQRISQTNAGVRNMIADNKVPFNGAQLRSRINAAKEESKLIFASDATAERTYNAVADEFVNQVKKKDTLGLFDARQNFDKIPAIKKLLDTESLGENVRRQIVLDVRRAANEYVAEQLPINSPFRFALKQETKMIEALGNIADKSASLIGKNKLQALAAEYPILKWLVGGIATGLAGSAGVGVGSAIIGSTD